MRNRIIIALTALLALAAVSCSEEQLAQEHQNVNAADSSGVYFYMYLPKVFGDNDYPTTRATTTEPGIDENNENLIENVDVFFYSTDASEDDAPHYKLLGCHFEQVTDASAEHLNHQYDEDHMKCLYKVYVRVTQADLKQIFGDNYTDPVNVYVVGNRPWSGYKGETYSKKEVKETIINTGWDKLVISSGYTFVMSGEQTLTPTPTYETDTDGNQKLKDVSVSGIVPMKRAAAKLQCLLNVADTCHIKSEEDTSVVATWVSMPENLTVSFYNGVKRGMVESIPADLGTDDYYTVLARRGYKLDESFYATADTKKEKEYKYSHDVFYTYPRAWGDDDGNESVVVVCIPWKLRIVGSEEQYELPVNTYYQFSANRMRNASNNNQHEFVRNTFYKLLLNITRPGSTDVAVPVEITPLGYTIQPWGVVDMGKDKDDDISGEFQSYDYLVVDPKTKIVENETSTTFTYSSSSAVTAKITSVNYNDYSTGSTVSTTLTDSAAIAKAGFTIDMSKTGQITVSHAIATAHVAFDIYITVQNATGLTETLHIKQYPELYIEMIDGDNVFVNGYYTHVKDAAHWNRTAISGESGYYYSYECQRNKSTYFVSYGAMYQDLSNTSGNLTQTTLLCINVTAFDKDNGYYTVDGTKYYYKIGDPRANGGFSSSDFNDYQATNKSGTSSYKKTYSSYSRTTYVKSWDDDAASLIMIGSTDESARQVIAPLFMVASGWASGSAVSFSNAQKKCATFQENGYPAGRWRLPTEAEIQFIIYLQENKYISTLFNTTSTTGYWAAGGRRYYYDKSQNKGIFESGTSSTTAFCRPVYDLWYWGYDAETANQYHIMPDKSGTDYAE